MKTTEQDISTAEETKNVITASIAGASFGLLYAYGSEVGIGIGLIAGALFGASLGFRISRIRLRMRYPMAVVRRILMASTFLLLSGSGYSYLLDQGLSQSQQLWAAVLPTLGWTALVISIGMAIASLDELQRRIQTEAIAIGFAGTSIFVVGYTLFQFTGRAGVNVGLVLLVMSLMLLLGKFWTLWRYR